MAYPITPPYLNPVEMQNFLQEVYGLPVVLKNKKWEAIYCPYCCNAHSVTGSGYVEAHCIDTPRTIVITGRSFHPNYGLHVFEFEQGEDGSYHLSPPAHLPMLVDFNP